jgi:hypothetical protein
MATEINEYLQIISKRNYEALIASHNLFLTIEKPRFSMRGKFSLVVVY